MLGPEKVKRDIWLVADDPAVVRNWWKINRAPALCSCGGSKPRASAIRSMIIFQDCCVNYAGAPPSAPGRGGATSGPTTTWRGGFSGGIFSPEAGVMLGGGFRSSPYSISSLICEPSRLSYSSND